MAEKTSKKSTSERFIRGTGRLIGGVAIGVVLGVELVIEGSVNFVRDGEKLQLFHRGPSRLPANEGAKRLEQYNTRKAEKGDEDRVAPANRIIAAVGEQAVKLQSWLDEELPLERLGRVQEYREQVEEGRLARKVRRLTSKEGRKSIKSQRMEQSESLDYGLDGLSDVAKDIIIATRVDPGYMQ